MICGKDLTHIFSYRFMNRTPAIPTTETPPKMSVKAARLLLQQAHEADHKREIEAAEAVHRRAFNPCTGASALVPREIIAAAATAVSEQGGCIEPSTGG